MGLGVCWVYEAGAEAWAQLPRQGQGLMHSWLGEGYHTGLTLGPQQEGPVPNETQPTNLPIGLPTSFQNMFPFVVIRDIFEFNIYNNEKRIADFYRTKTLHVFYAP